MQHENLKKAEITEGELEAQVHEHGIVDMAHVSLALLEIDGNISVISDDYNENQHNE